MASAAEALQEKPDSATSAAETKLHSQAVDYLRQYTPAALSVQTDMLESRYHIEMGSRLPEYDTKNARAYAATDSKDMVSNLFALVCQRPGMQRMAAIQQLKNITSPHMMVPIAAGVVKFSQPAEERFVVLYQRPAGKRLIDLLAATNGELNENFILRNIIDPIALAVSQMAELGITHGSINTSNIYFTDVPMLGDCVTEPCGFSQPFYYEPLERLQAAPSAKGEIDANQDFYSLAVLVLELLYRPGHFAVMTPEGLAASILREGVYNALTRHKEVPETFFDFFRGMLSQNKYDRWNYRYLKSWLDGKRYNVLLPPPPAEAIRPFEFNGHIANTRRELADILYHGREHIPEILQSGQLLHWVSISLRNKELAEAVSRITRTVGELAGKNEIQLNEQIMRLIMLFDPVGPLRFAQLSFHVDGIGSLVTELFATKAEKDIQLLARFVEFNMVTFWLDQQRKDPLYTIPPSVNDMLLRIERLRLCVRNSGYGFGLERILYELNPEMPCQSPLCAGEHITTLAALLKRLDKIASNSKEQEPVDRHIAAFIASKCQLQHEIRLNDVDGLPAAAAQRLLPGLRLLAIAQQRNDIVLPGLTHWVALRLLPMLDSLHSKSLRREVKATLLSYAETGDLGRLSEMIVESGYGSLDQNGFTRAKETFEYNARKIEEYKHDDFIAQKSMALGFTISKLLAYLFLILGLVGVAYHG